jgi:predicted glutamine amidotransferase
MCLLCYTSPGNEPDWKGLEVACLNNPDGFGWAIHHETHIQIGKAMHYMDALESYYDAIHAVDLELPSMFHARWATHGVEDLTNVHPFYVGDTQDTVLAHNGVLPVTIPKGDPRSDTRYFAEELLPLRSEHVFDKRKPRRKLEKWMGGSKFVVFTTASQHAEPVYILNEDLGHWDNEGRWWSNDSYQKPWYASYRGKYGNVTGGWEDDDLMMAAYKGAKVEDPDRYCPGCQVWLSRQEFLVLGVCGTCSICLGCEANAKDCMCYTPSTSTYTQDTLNYEDDSFAEGYESYDQYLKDGGTPIALEFSASKPYSTDRWTFGSPTNPTIDF